MSALGFFRKNQRMVFWIMVVLMVVFLVTINGAQPFYDLVAPRGDKAVIGHAGRLQRYDIRQRDEQAALTDLALLKAMGLGNPARVLVDPLIAGSPTELPGELGFMLLNDPATRREGDPARDWLLLRREAQELGFSSSPAMARDSLEHWLGWNDEQVGRAVQELRQMERIQNLQAKDVYSAMEGYLLVAQAFEASRGSLEPTEPELRQLYRDTNQKMSLAGLAFPAKDYVSKVGEPTEEQVVELFNSARKEVPDDPANTNAFKFGYRLPDRVQVEYVFVDYAAVLASAQPAEEAMYQYYQTHQPEFTTPAASVPATSSAPASAPATMAASKPASQPVVMRYSQAKPEIRRKLQQQEAQRKLREIADSVLNRVNTAAPATTATSQGASTLESVQLEMLKEGLPVVYGRTKPLSAQQLSEEPIVGSARRKPNGPSLVQAAFGVKELSSSERAALAVGEVYNGVMDVGGAESGKLVWRVAQAKPSEVPDESLLKTDEALHSRVRDNWRTMQAYQLAVKAAQDAMEKAQREGLEKVAAGLNKKLQESPAPISRKVIAPSFTQDPYLQEIIGSAFSMLQWLQGGRKGEQPRAYSDAFYLQAAKVNPYFVAVPNAPLGEAWLPDQAQKFIDAVFALAPKDVSEEPPATQPTSQPAPASAMTVVELPGEHQVVVAQRVQFLPAYESGYRDRRSGLIRELREMRRHELAVRWFSESDILQRTNYQRAK
jgi:hypothetical protein